MKIKLLIITLLFTFIVLFACSCDVIPDNNGDKQDTENSEKQDDETSGNDTASGQKDPCEHIYGEWRTTKLATCTEEGTRRRTCTKCSESEEEEIPKSNTHKIFTLEAVPPTCKSTGLTEGAICTACGKVIHPQSVIPTNDEHTLVTDDAVEATCAKTGLTEGKHCSACNKVIVAQTVVPTNDNHTPVTDAAIPASCKDTDLTEGSHCSACNKVLVAQTISPKTDDHLSSDWIIDVEATCKAEGEKHKECTVCKQVLESVKIEKFPTHAALKTDYKMPSGTFCGDTGSYSVSTSCADCGEVISSEYQDIPEKHSMENGTCKVCGLPESTTAGLYFGLNPDGKSYYVMPRGDFAGGKVVIGVYNDLSVTEVGFAGCENLNIIVLGDCVERIGTFEACLNLYSVTIGDRIKEIPEYAF